MQIGDYWQWILVAVVILAILIFLLLRPKQRVELSNQNTPVRPHMQRSEHEGRGLAAEAAAAASDVTGQFLEASVHANLPGASGPPDDLQRLKGVGPRFASQLNELGITRFDQLASLGDADIEWLDSKLGPFAGRVRRDQIPLQAEYLASGDQDGFEQRFGKL
jgi:predicted flap endonuclease-1-like 5' DNA nuclease